VSDVDYSWQLSGGEQCQKPHLAEGIVSSEFFQLLDIINRDETGEQQYERLEVLKKEMTERFWSLNLEQAFSNVRLILDQTLK
jgi:hypothetical protein